MRREGAIYTLSYVQRDGNPHDVAEFGNDLRAALVARKTEERKAVVRCMRAVRKANPSMPEPDVLRYARSTVRGSIHYMVWDADDPERGYFDSEEED